MSDGLARLKFKLQKMYTSLITGKRLTVINFTIVAYFGLMWGIYVYQIDTIVTNFLMQLLTIPFFIAQFVFLGIGIVHLIKNPVSYLTFFSVVALAACIFLTLRSFILV